MEKSYSESYAAAGVDITAGYRSVELMKQYVAPVSYTHLDVYKRQALYSPRICPRGGRGGGRRDRGRQHGGGPGLRI